MEGKEEIASLLLESFILKKEKNETELILKTLLQKFKITICIKLKGLKWYLEKLLRMINSKTYFSKSIRFQR